MILDPTDAARRTFVAELIERPAQLARIADNARHQPLLFLSWERDAIALAESIVASS